jgi:hypothetical protein
MVLGVAGVFWRLYYIPELCGIKEEAKNLGAREEIEVRRS